MFKFTFQTRFVDVKRIWATFVGFLKIQDGGQKEIMRGQFIFRFTVLSLLPCIFVLSLNISGLGWWTNFLMSHQIPFRKHIPLFTLSWNFSSCGLQFLRKWSNDKKCNYIHLGQDFAGDHPRWIINLHMNCEDIVQRNYKQRLQLFCFNFFFAEFTEINNKK